MQAAPPHYRTAGRPGEEDDAARSHETSGAWEGPQDDEGDEDRSSDYGKLTGAQAKYETALRQGLKTVASVPKTAPVG